MTALFDYPKGAAFGRVVPKNKIYEHAGASTALKDLFITQVDQIVWKFKLAPETINLAANRSVSEIQVFSISLRKAELDLDVLRAIDRAIPFPLIFELSWSGRSKVVAAFKRPSEADSTKWVLSEYFETVWMDDGPLRQPLPIALNLASLYEQILTSLMPAQVASDEGIQARVARMEAIRAKTREVERITLRLNREKQFNKRVAINAELRAARLQLAELKQEKLAVADDRQSAASE
ncbi:DUF4391 domain-containing protein [Novosphingobium pituita]|uniref:Methyl-accepting chemotaxis protein n=1 Tax=Novosphingobium pituita TaxID=3056842 RepID=A0ABQ6PC46_9SPHN|nr:DUF4391 domain-containing protein [Novosphingobium sp. IK01]GMM62431.1 hypothetical protein NUTIK01_32080 [Novosphingobium sp. IK01]